MAKDILIREKYLRRIRPFVEETEIIKVLVGVRRCGKSTILMQIKDELISSGVSDENMVFINLDKRPYKSIKTAEQLEQILDEKVSAENKTYIFLDEIQNVKDYEAVVEAFRLEGNCSIFLTGSNSYLLSGELATKLTGRYIEFDIQPFSFSEVVDYNPEGDINELFNEFLRYGGLPYLQRLEDSEKNIYIKSVIDEIFEKDLKRRLRIRDRGLFDRVLRFMCTNSGTTVSTDSIRKYLRNEHISTTVKTISKYIKGIENARIIIPCERYDIRGKRNLRYYEKEYVVDPAFRTYFSLGSPDSYSMLLETMVHNELISRGLTVKVGKLRNSEVDFVVSNGERIAYIQVTYIMESEETKKREFGPLEAIRDGYRKVIISMDPINMSANGIDNIHILDFLLDKKNIF